MSLRIFTAVRHSNDPRFFYGGLWSANFYPALRELGHEIVESQTDLLPTSRFMHVSGDFTREELSERARTTEQILCEVRAAQRRGPVHLFLSYFYNAHFDPSGFDELRRMGIPSVNFYCNSVYQFSTVAAVAARADFSWHAEREARDKYLAAGGRPVWVQMGADPNVYRPVPGAARRAKACFVGQRYADRDRLLATLVRAGVPVDIYGSGWAAASNGDGPRADEAAGVYLGRRVHRPGSAASYAAALGRTVAVGGLFGGLNRAARQWAYRDETRRIAPLLAPHARGRAGDVAEVFSEYELCLNFSNVWADGSPGAALIPHVRLRDFEAPMCRACYLTGHTDEIAEFYEVGREIDTYRDAAELADKARFYLAHTDAAERMREAGYRRALRDHTWKSRFAELFRKIGVGTVRSGEAPPSNSRVFA